MSSLEIVAASIALLALLVTGLSMNVSRLRIRHRVSYGDGGHKDLLVAIRAHGNAIEHVPLYAALAVAAAMLQYTSAVCRAWRCESGSSVPCCGVQCRCV